ncbi:MAG: hypothetical protein K6D94_12000 [Clostridiales bacterium]|nr:hypothetical protein [Clostridiales bacterium]
MDFECEATPEAIKVKTDEGSAVIYIRDDDTLVIVSENLDLKLKLTHYGYGTQIGEGRFRIISGVLSLYHTLYVQQGNGVIDGPFHKCEGGNDRNHKTDVSLRCENGRLVAALSVNYREPKDIALPISPEKEIAAVKDEWKQFLKLIPGSELTGDVKADEYSAVTWFNLWSCFVRADGIYAGDTMMMSKKTMSSTWSWDHCFNALIMADLADKSAAKKYAMSQFSAPFWLQGETGVLPDMWNPGLETRWGTTKPPIHGWCFSRLMDKFDFNGDELKQVYVWLEKWTGWWLRYSDSDGDGIPDYPQGCDSGWDNSTLFDIGYYLESPDLPAFLVLQLKTLARIAAAVGDSENEERWLEESDALLKRLITHSWTGGRFAAKLSGSHEYDESPTSLLSLMPLVLGDLLPKDMQESLVGILEKDFLTENGPATEMPSSPKYRPDGYWRGPIWAPTTYLLIDGLRRGGYEGLAEDIAGRYCRMSREKAKGNYENFDALTGLGRRAPGYTWAASVYMLLRCEYGK